jgi:hypothetical protein
LRDKVCTELTDVKETLAPKPNVRRNNIDLIKMFREEVIEDIKNINLIKIFRKKVIEDITNIKEPDLPDLPAKIRFDVYDKYKILKSGYKTVSDHNFIKWAYGISYHNEISRVYYMFHATVN